MSPSGRIIILIASFCAEPFCQILISASGQISTPTVCSVETCSLESANYLFCRLDIKDAGHSEWRERAFYASDLAPSVASTNERIYVPKSYDSHFRCMLRKSSTVFCN